MKHFYPLQFLLICGFVASFTGANSQIPKRKIEFKSSARPLESLFRSTSSGVNVPGSTGTSATEPDRTAQHRCYSLEADAFLHQRNPNLPASADFERALAQRISSTRSEIDVNTLLRIPTVIHIVHSGESVGFGTNLSREQVMSQFDVLNEDFRRLGSGYNDHPAGADINIEFVPATVDPDGNIMQEPGIDRVRGYSAYYDFYNTEVELKPNTQWDPDRYLNIWVVRFGGDFSNYLGYAQFPTLSGLEGIPEQIGAETDGVVISYHVFGRTGNVSAPYNQGRTTTHEVGHWLGLRHIWGDGDCSVDDYCADTPNADGPNYQCTFRDSCPEEGDDMIENFMDYTPDGCMNIFTIDQRLRIRTVLAMSPRRKSLIVCQQAPPAFVGLNEGYERFNWYEYTSQTDEIVTLSSLSHTEADTKLSIYYACNTLPSISNDDAADTKQSQLSIALSAGETIKILWEGDDSLMPIAWTLATETPQAGAACGVAVQANEGTNTVPPVQRTYWYKYTSNNRNKITINSHGHYFTVYEGGCERLMHNYSGPDNATIFDVAANETIYIEFQPNAEPFEWALETAPLRMGESCADATEPVNGENTIPYNGPFEYWYRFTMPATGRLKLSKPADALPVSVSILTACDGYLLSEQTADAIALEHELVAGQTVFIRWKAPEDAGTVQWLMEAQAYSNGEICAAARPAQVGMNHTDAAPQWFHFTTTKRANLKISSVGFSEVDTHLIIKRDCDGAILADNDNKNSANGSSIQSELVLYDVPPGETFYIEWSEKWSYEGFDWTLEEVPTLPGDNCSTAQPAQLGANMIEYSPAHDYFGGIYWTKFTIPESGKKLTVNSTIPVDVAIYINHNCNAFEWVDENQGKAQAFELPSGTEVVIIWDMQDFEANFIWHLTLDDIAAGDRCETPLRAVQGQNIATATPVWYDYVMTQPGSLRIRSRHLEPTTVAFLAAVKGCGEQLEILATGENELLITELEGGDHLGIFMTLGFPFDGINWTLEELPRKQGDVCSDPIPAAYGNNQTAYASQWFSYTAQTSGNLRITSRPFTLTNTDLYVYDGCNGNILGHSDDVFSDEFILYTQSEVVIENVEAGQQILINWAATHSSEGFTWQIATDQPQRGDRCSEPLVAIEGVNNGMKAMPQWFEFTMPQTSSLTLTSLGYTYFRTNVEVWDSCEGTLIAAHDDPFITQSFVHIPELQEGQRVLIRWGSDVPSAHYTYDWRLIVGEPDPGLFCEFRAEANIGANEVPEYISSSYWYKFTMPAANKKLVITTRANTTSSISIGLTRGCDLLSVLQHAETTMTYVGLEQGEEISIFFTQSNVDQIRYTFQWELQLLDLEPGDQCNNPILPDVDEIHQVTGAPTWYAFTMPFEGNILLSSADVNPNWINTYVEVYDGCDGNLIASNDDKEGELTFLSELLLENVQAGETVYIKWATAGPYQFPFNWFLTVDYPNNHAPILDDVSFVIPINANNGEWIGTLEAVDMDGDALYYSLVDGNSDQAFALDVSSGRLTVADKSKLSAAIAGRQLVVEVTDLKSSAEAVITLDVVTSTPEDESNVVKVFPNPAKDEFYLELPSDYTVIASTITDAYGNQLRVYGGEARHFSTAAFPSGVYLLKVFTNHGQFVAKVVVTE